MEAQFELIVTAALLGTERQGFTAPASEGALGEALRAAIKPPDEQSLLRCAAIASVYRTAGRKPPRGTSKPPPAQEDPTPVCPRKAADLLARILAGQHAEVLPEWLAGAREAGVRAPHRLLPALLDRAAAKTDLREGVVAVMGRRGQWLMEQNPAWQFDRQGDDEQVWQTGPRDARAAALARLRSRDPAKARALVKSTWDQETPDDRARFLGAFAAGLSDADDEMLESALDDKRKEVRKAAAELLARLPASRLVKRMIDRVSPLVTLSKTSKSKRVIAVKLLDDCDKAMTRDGVEPKSSGPTNLGKKQWLLAQMLSYVPPGHWCQAWGLRPHECVAAAAGEFEEALLEGWGGACQRNPNPDWIEPLVRRYSARGGGQVASDLLGLLPPKRFSAVAVDLLNEKSANLETCAGVIKAGVPLDESATRALLRRMKQELERKKHAYSELWYLLPQMPMRLPAGMLDDIAAALGEKPFEPVRRQVDELLAALAFRKEVSEAFGTARK